MRATNGVLTVVGSGLDVPIIMLSDTGTWGTEAVGHRVIGRAGVLPSSGVRRSRTGTLRVACPSPAAWRALRTILETGRTLDLTTEVDCDRVTQARLLVLEASDAWLVDGGSVRVVELRYETVTEDPPPVERSWTWLAVDVAEAWPTWTEFHASFGSWGGVLGRLEGEGVGW